MEVILAAIDKGGEHSVPHDLNFQAERYEAKHIIVGLDSILTRSLKLLMTTPSTFARHSRILSRICWRLSKTQVLHLERRTE